MILLYRIILTLIAAILCFTFMVKAWGGWDVSECLTRIYSDPATAPASC